MVGLQEPLVVVLADFDSTFTPGERPGGVRRQYAALELSLGKSFLIHLVHLFDLSLCNIVLFSAFPPILQIRHIFLWPHPPRNLYWRHSPERGRE